MIFLAVNLDGTEVCSNFKLFRSSNKWTIIPNTETVNIFDSQFVYNGNLEDNCDNYITILPTGTIKKLIGIELTWENNPKIYYK